MKKLTQIIATAFLTLALGYPSLAIPKENKFNLKQAEEITRDTKISLEGNSSDSYFSDTLETEKGYMARGRERQFYGFTSNGEVYIELMLFKNKEKKLGEETNYDYIAFWGDPSEFSMEDFRKDKKYMIEDKTLEVGVDQSGFKKELEKIDYPSTNFWCRKGRGRPFTLYEEDIAHNLTIYFGIRVKNLETGKSENLVYSVKIIGKDEKGNPQFRGYSNGIINYQDTDNDPVPKITVEKIKGESKK